MARPFQNFRRPVVYILDQELRKRDLKNKISLNSPSSDSNNSDLPMYPIELVKDPITNQVIKCLHSTGDTQWSEEFIRTDGKVSQIITTYPDGASSTLQIIRDPSVHYIDEV